MHKIEQPRESRRQFQAFALRCQRRFCEIVAEVLAGPIVGSIVMDQPGFQAQFERNGEMVEGDVSINVVCWQQARAQKASGISDQEMSVGRSGIFLVMESILSTGVGP